MRLQIYVINNLIFFYRIKIHFPFSFSSMVRQGKARRRGWDGMGERGGGREFAGYLIWFYG